MNQEKSAQLFKTFPNLFRQNRSDLRRTLMAFGFECRDGWFGLVNECLGRLNTLEPTCEVIQVKEKWGSLRVYVDGSDADVAITQEYEDRSRSVCEVCGEVGSLREDLGWTQTLCELHFGETQRDEALRWKTGNFDT